MSTLIEQIQEQRWKLRGDVSQVAEYDILTLLVGELETASTRDRSDITDAKVNAAAKKLIKSNNETLKLIPADSSKWGVLVKQNQALDAYLPDEMTEEQIRSEIQFRNATIPYASIGEVMAELNKVFPGKFDKGLASKIAKELFQ